MKSQTTKTLQQILDQNHQHVLSKRLYQDAAAMNTKRIPQTHQKTYQYFRALDTQPTHHAPTTTQTYTTTTLP